MYFIIIKKNIKRVIDSGIVIEEVSTDEALEDHIEVAAELGDEVLKVIKGTEMKFEATLSIKIEDKYEPKFS